MEPIVFDTESGISVEEQKEILAGLNTLDRLESGNTANGGPAVPYEKQARKKGVMLPALANGIAAALLLLGCAALVIMHKRDEVRFIQGGAAPSITERMLIAEIRREFADMVNAKDAEIAEILSKIAGIDREMQNIQIRFENKEMLESEKDKALADLQREKDEYQARLTALQRERGQLLEDARLREADLHSQRSVNKELSAQMQSVQTELTSAQEEIRRLTGEQEKNALIDRQIDGYFAAVNEQISAALFSEAAATLSSLQAFLDTPSFQGIKAFHDQKPARLTLVNTLSRLVAASIRTNEGRAEAAAPAENAETDAVSGRLEQYEKTIAELTARNDELERTARERSNSNTAASATVNELRNRTQTLEKTLAAQESTLTEARNQNAALQQSLTARENALAEARNQNAALQQNLAARENTVTELRSQVSSLQESVTQKDASLSSLQAQNSELQQRAEQLQTQNDAIRQLLNN
ncbi:MAG: hypothetical protein LBP19_10895 [Treponema sp.]|jgi:chromosome segregation ATPase|nr:hypothetical protein [Treponema sp.]